MVHCESFLPSMKDLNEDSNTWSSSMHCGDKNGQNQNGFSMRAPPPPLESYSGYEREFLKQTMLQHEAVFKNQVHELHRLYRTQKSLMDEVKGNNSEHTPESAIKRDLPAFLLGNSVCGEGSSSQACKVPMANGVSSKEEEVRPVKVRRRMIDLQRPPDEYLDDADGENSSSPQEAGELPERGNASHLIGSSLVMKNPTGLTDLNVPVQCQESSVHGPSSRDIYSLYGNNIANAQRQWLEANTSQNGWMVLEAGNGKGFPRENLCMPSQSVQVLANHAFQPLSYPSTDHRKFLSEARQRNPEVSYESYVESSVASNAPSLTNGYRPESGRTWSHWIPSRENRSSSSFQKSLPFQTNPFLSFNTQARADSSSEKRSLYQGISSGSKETAFNLPSGNLNHLNNGTKGDVRSGSLSEALKHQRFESLQGPKNQELSAGLPWLKPKPLPKNGITNGGFDLNASAVSDAVDGSSNVYPHNGLRSFSCSNDANLGRAEVASSLSNGKILGYPISQKRSIWEVDSSVCLTDQPKKANTMVKRNLDINLPCDASEDVVVDKEGGKRAATNRHYIDLNLCATEDESSGLCSKPRMETRATPLIDLEAPPTLESEEEGEKMVEKRDVTGETFDELIKGAAEAIVTISLSHDTDEAASSTNDAVAKDPLSWFVNTIASCGNDLEKKIDACEGCREECSSGEFDYFEAMTLNLPPAKEEDYMPTRLVPEHLKFDGTDSLGITANRPRRGQARRGRPRRDFQRDVLPGLASMSRLEVTEDLQMFEGLMKATGYSWNSGVARRSSNRGGSTRGRKRLVSNVNNAPVCSSLEQPMDNSNVQMVGLEDRSLTGWGNATRRPRRQRCPAGTPPTVVLT
ncbi:unnamed protein product [Eruca vesicaria subsp. sativa]|uniref:Uncharacterized protein n=1 Tax=Eruca vesicaria subsp. sativa TaxID=29727 RepID=A0ABC8L6K1_ERUVS|nr:unnamed protein product [Eruca vesicaria subsp. sativa]